QRNPNRIGYNRPMPTVANASRALPLAVVILAAGEGKRMKSGLPKVLQPLAGRPLLAHVIDTARALEPPSIHIVYGHGADHVREAFASDTALASGTGLSWALQAQRLGTGHAVTQAMPDIPDDRRVLILYGDVPLIQHSTLEALLALAGPRQVALLTMMLD